MLSKKSIYDTENVEIDSGQSLDRAAPMEESTKTGGKSVAARRKRLRETLWPEIKEEQLWLRSRSVGFTTIPRTMPLIGLILDRLSGKGIPLLSTYLTLWCWVFDEGIVEVRNPRELAHESGFSGPRAEATWRSRMRRLEELGFIKAKAGLAGEFQHVLLMNPLQRIKQLYANATNDPLYIGLLGRLSQIGADDMDMLMDSPQDNVLVAQKLADELMHLHHSMEDNKTTDGDWSLARALEDRLGSGQFLPGDIEKAQLLLRKKRVSAP